MTSKGQELKENEMHKAFKFRLLPTQEQEVLLSKHFGCVRFIYNYFLSEKQKHYQENKKTLNFNQCAGSLVAKKKEEGFEWLKEVNSQALVSSLMSLETAYGNFFKKRARFPKFKSRKGKNSFIVPQHVKVEEKGLVKIPMFKEGIRFVEHRDLKGKIKSATVSRTKTGKYYISFLCVVEKPLQFQKTGKNIGIDLGLKDFIITSEGQRFVNPKYIKQYEKELKKQQKHFSRKQNGSKRKEKQKIKVAKIYEKITNSRNDMQHKVSLKLIQNYDLIVIEDLNVKGMVKNHCLARAISDVSWSSFVTKLKYKAEWYGKTVCVIDRFYPSSKTCSCCGHIKESLDLSERSWTCSSCNTEHDRDVNAAKNILKRAETIQSSGTDDYRHGAEVRPKRVSKASGGIGDEVSKKKGRKYTLKPFEPFTKQ
jgi:putative transposase